MILIKKGREPKSLTQYKMQNNAYFDGCNKKDIRKVLLEEQGYLCAYCMRRISEDNMKIEHYNSQSNITDKEALDFSNMLGVCDGNEGSGSKKTQTCDTHKGNTLLTINPFSNSSIELIQYKNDGTIYSCDKNINKDINETLNLNCQEVMLKRNRKEVLDRVKKYLSKKKMQGDWSRDLLIKTLNKFQTKDSNEKLDPYIGIAVWYLKKKISNKNIKR